MFRKLISIFGFKRSSIIEDLAAQLSAADPHFGKVRNDHPSEEFVFELRSLSSLPSIQQMSDGRLNEEVTAVDDYGAVVSEVPLGATSRVFFFDLISHKIELQTDQDQMAMQDFLVGLCRGIIDCIDDLELPSRRKKKLKSLRMSRFYYNSSCSWWTFTHE